MSLSFDAKLSRFAALSIHSGLGLMPGQELIISADISCAPFVRLLQEEAYKAGAKSVFPLYSDEQGTLIRYRHGSSDAISYAPEWYYNAAAEMLENGGATLSISAGDPGLLKAVDPSLVAASSKAGAEASRRLRDVIVGAKANWCAVPYATPAWAKKVFPDDTEETAVQKLWEAIFATTRVDADDPTAAWSDHCSKLETHASLLNDRRFSALRFFGPGTDLKVGLADDHLWVAARLKAENGAICIPNMPTEEVFTMPHRDRVDGYVRSTKPLSLRGTVVEGIEVQFAAGRVVSAKASKGEDQLLRLIDTDEGARFLGEVALVPNSSAVSNTDLLFFNTLFDENAACHIALGQAYAETLRDVEALSDSERRSKGMNESLVHVDWMIGSGEVDVDGLGPDGSAYPVMRAGEWV
jgi:aminopeptidase